MTIALRNPAARQATALAAEDEREAEQAAEGRADLSRRPDLSFQQRG